MIVIGIIAGGAGADTEKMGEGMRYSWAVLSPQWYLVVVGVQAIGLTLSFALGFGATRRDFWLGTSLMFGIVSVLNAVAIATLVQLEKATDGWWLNVAMFDALWYGQNGWLVDFYTTLALQLFVLFIGASVTTVYLRWRMRGMLILAFGRDRPRPRRESPSRPSPRAGRRSSSGSEASASWACSPSCSDSRRCSRSAATS